jgi:transposase-like protein
MGKERSKVNPERQRQRFSREFKLEAVRLLELRQKPGTQLSLELGIRRNLLYKWQKELGDQRQGSVSRVWAQTGRSAKRSGTIES